MSLQQPSPRNDQCSAFVRDTLSEWSDDALLSTWEFAVETLDILRTYPESKSLAGLVSIALYALYQERERRISKQEGDDRWR